MWYIYNVNSGGIMSDDKLNMPKSNYLDSKKQDTKKNSIDSYEEYKALLADTTHPDNQTMAYANRISSTLQRLLVTADQMDSINPGEGIFGLIVLSLRSILKLKDENVKLQAEIRDLKIKSSSVRKTAATLKKK